MKDYKIDKELFIKNRKKMFSNLKEKSVAIIYSNSFMPRNGDQFYPFRQNSDFFYLTGIDQDKTILAICPQHHNKKYNEILFIPNTDEKSKIWSGPKYSKEFAAEISGIETIKWLDEFEAIITDLIINSDNIYLDHNEKQTFNSEYLSPNRKLIQDIQAKYPLHQYNRLSPIITNLRLIKEPEEIKLIIQACEITEKAFYKILEFVKPEVMEYEVEAEITSSFIKKWQVVSLYPVMMMNSPEGISITISGLDI